MRSQFLAYRFFRQSPTLKARAQNGRGDHGIAHNGTKRLCAWRAAPGLPNFSPCVALPMRALCSFGRDDVQRLFSTFADRWPGVGLLLLRLLTGAALVHFGISSIRAGAPTLIIVLQTIGMACGLVLLVGLFTPVAGALAAIIKVWIAISRFFSHSGDPWIALAQAILAAALAMIGPGAWSIDARRFGRKHIELRDR